MKEKIVFAYLIPKMCFSLMNLLIRFVETNSHQIKSFFDNESERGKTFVYKLLDLIRNRDEKNRINFARLAYYLARLEEDTPKERREEFRKFKHNMRNWYDDEKEIRQVEMALVLYIYSIREE